MADTTTTEVFEDSTVDSSNLPQAKGISIEQEEPKADVARAKTEHAEDAKGDQNEVFVEGDMNNAEEEKQQVEESKDDDNTGDKEDEGFEAVVPVTGSGPEEMTGKVLYSWLKHHDSRLHSLEKCVEKKTEEADSEQGGKEDAKSFMFRAKQEVRDCNWQQFKNCFSTKEPPAVIEVLLAGEDLKAEIEDEQLRRVSPKRRQELTRVARKLERSPRNKKTDTQRMERVRINSLIILGFLAKVTGETHWSSKPHKPHTFLRPFKIFIHFRKEMEEEFSRLKAKFGQSTLSVDRDKLSSQVPQTNVAEETNTEDLLLHIEQGTLKAYEEMKCYMEFMEARLLPRYTMFDTFNAIKPVKVRYDDLWYLFRPGETVYQPSDAKTNSDLGIPEDMNSHSQESVPRLWRVFFMAMDNAHWEVDDLESKSDGKLVRDVQTRYEGAMIYVYYIDFDGKSYSGVSNRFHIDHYSGEKDINALPIYPLRFAPDHDQTVQRLKERGQKFQSVATQSHDPQSYEGWTLIDDPLGDPLQDNRGEDLRFPEHIDGDVIVDFNETYQTMPWWKPDFTRFLSFANCEATSRLDDFAIIQWNDADRKESIGKIHEVVIDEDNVDKREWNILSAEDKIFPSVDGKAGKINDNVLELSDDDLCLLPSRIFVYGLRNRKFVSVDIRYLQTSSIMENPFEHLKIPEKHKMMIQSTVFEHFEKKKVQREAAKIDRELPDQDFIGRKGRGLIFLVHGAPGVGKTATAEAVAYAYKKPLFSITCGDLGFDLRSVETTLSTIFRLANLWDCILLFDEAEIFLSRREQRDDNIERNALVSIFLRTLEYYPGILFLTTNRVGALDEAVKSRVHMSLFYPYLGETETLSLFRMNISRLQRIEKERTEIMAIDGAKPMIIEEDGILQFAKEHFKRHKENPDTRWNGRQIRNAFQTAASLARYEHHCKPHRGLFLGAPHFKTVEEATVEFEEYRQEMYGKHEAEIVADRGERVNDRLRQNRKLTEKNRT